MSGHSKWKTIKHQKGAADAKRGQLFTRLTREISLAARQGAGGDPEMNYPLRLAIDRARANNMPSDTIERAIKRGSGEGADQDQLEEITYEGYGPGGVAIMLQTVTDNRNRTASEVRATFSKSGASLGASGCVAWNFETMGLITMEMTPEDAEDMALLAIDAGAEDVRVDDSYVEVFTLPEKLEAVKRQLEEEKRLHRHGGGVNGAQGDRCPGAQAGGANPAAAGLAGGPSGRPEGLHQRRFPRRDPGKVPRRGVGPVVKVLGIDPGTIHLGYGLLEESDGELQVHDYGSLDFKSSLPVEERLYQVHSHLMNMIGMFRPDEIAIEEPFMGQGANRFVGPAFAVGQARRRCS